MNFDALLIRFNKEYRQIIFGILIFSWREKKTRSLFLIHYYADFIPELDESAETADRILIINILFMQFIKRFKKEEQK